MAHGIGSFWFPEFSALGFAHNVPFHEHPPLVFGIQALFFKLLGDSIYVERFYSFLSACLTAFMISKIWKLNTVDYAHLKKMSWLPILLWIIVPVGYWSFQNNMMENTMGVFTLLSVYFALKSCYVTKRDYLNVLLAGIFIFLASFSKGPPGLFPIGVIALAWVVNRDRPLSRVILHTAILILVPAAIYALITLDPDAFKSLSAYFNDRLLGRIASAHTADSRFFIIQRLGMELIPAMALCGIMLAVYKFNSIKQRLERAYKNRIIMFILIGCMASIPLALSLVQKGFYFTPSLPYFAIGLALLIAPGLEVLISKIALESKGFKLFKLLTGMVLISVFIISALQIGKTSRNADQMQDIYLLGEVIPAHSTVNIDKAMWNRWDLQCQLIRHFNISLDPSEQIHEYYLLDKSLKPDIEDGYVKLDLPTKKYSLYQRKVY